MYICIHIYFIWKYKI